VLLNSDTYNAQDQEIHKYLLTTLDKSQISAKFPNSEKLGNTSGALKNALPQKNKQVRGNPLQ